MRYPNTTRGNEGRGDQGSCGGIRKRDGSGNGIGLQKSKYVIFGLVTVAVIGIGLYLKNKKRGKTK